MVFSAVVNQSYTYIPNYTTYIKGCYTFSVISFKKWKIIVELALKIEKTFNFGFNM